MSSSASIPFSGPVNTGVQGPTVPDNKRGADTEHDVLAPKKTKSEKQKAKDKKQSKANKKRKRQAGKNNNNGDQSQQANNDIQTLDEDLDEDDGFSPFVGGDEDPLLLNNTYVVNPHAAGSAEQSAPNVKMQQRFERIEADLAAARAKINTMSAPRTIGMEMSKDPKDICGCTKAEHWVWLLSTTKGRAIIDKRFADIKSNCLDSA
ncbi:hypothetical protein N0V86_008478 [Didymella sp. IMI 355093]|nr:hypothetical protein N0V86_008478 [Didymella sp. IMI 355093]